MPNSQLNREKREAILERAIQRNDKEREDTAFQKEFCRDRLKRKQDRQGKGRMS